MRRRVLPGGGYAAGIRGPQSCRICTGPPVARAKSGNPPAIPPKPAKKRATAKRSAKQATTAPKTQRGRPAAYLTEKELAATLEVSEPQVRDWRADGCPHQVRDGVIVFRMPKVIEWRLAQAKRAAIDALDIDVARENKRMARANADIREMDRDERRRSLGPIAAMDAVVERIAVAVRSEVRGIRPRFAPRIVGLATASDAALVLDEMAAQILKALRGAMGSVADEAKRGRSGDAEAAA